MFDKISLSGVSNTEWLRLRKSGIGGSDAGAICGVNPYSSAMKVFRDKTSESVEEQDSEAVRIGHDLEDYVAQRFTEATGLKVRKSNFMYRSVEHPFMIADVDRLVGERMPDWSAKLPAPTMRTNGRTGISRSTISCSATITWR